MAGGDWKSVCKDNSLVAYPTCFMGTRNGRIVVSVNRGATWSTSYQGNAVNDIVSISCPSETVCYALDAVCSQVVFTVDGGKSWSIEVFGIYNLAGISCPTLTTCYAVAGSGLILASFDGSKTWSIKRNGLAYEYLEAISCPSATTCFAVGGNNSLILVTTNSGVDWVQQSPAMNYGLFSIHCQNENVCFAGGNDGVQSTVDGGKHWNIAAQTNYTVFSVNCPVSNYCYAGGSAGIILSTTTGTDWIANHLFDAPIILTSISCPDVLTCYAVGWGAIMATTNGGFSWKILYNQGEAFSDISCPTPKLCLATLNMSTGVLITDDAGSNWHYQSYNFQSSTSVSLNSITCPPYGFPTGVCFVAGGGLIGKTTNYGLSWDFQILDPNFNFTNISCSNSATSSSTCYAIGHNINYDTPGSIIGVTQNGSNWIVQKPVEISNINLNGIYCLDSLNCIGAGDTGKVEVTVDGGQSWNSGVSNTAARLLKVTCAGSTKCYAVGSNGTIINSKDGGLNWTPQFSHFSTFFLNSISCPGPENCYIAGDYQTILAKRPLPLVVNSTVDDGSGKNGTLSYALNNAKPGQTIFLSVPGQTITLSGPLPPVPQGVKISSGSCNLPVTIDANKVQGTILNLTGKSTIEGVNIINRNGKGILAAGTGNFFKCIKINA